MDEALSSEDTVVRLWAAREVRARLDGAVLAVALDRLKRDRFMPVRREALLGFVEKVPTRAATELRAALFDPHGSVRETARFHLRHQGQVEVAEHYRAALDRGDVPVAAAVAGLGETGGAADAPRLAPFLAHPDPRVRRAAVRAVARLDLAEHVEPLLRALQDPAPSVAGAARDALRPRAHLAGPDRLGRVLDAATHRHARKAALTLIAQLPWWDAAPLVVQAAASENAQTRELAKPFLDQVAFRAGGASTVRPTDDQWDRLNAALTAHRPELEPAVCRNLEAVLDYAKRRRG